MLLIDLEKEIVVYYNRALILIYEDFNRNYLIEYPCRVPEGEAVQVDFATNKLQDKIWGVSDFNDKRIIFSIWSIEE